MKIAIVGAQGTGKSSLRSALEKDLALAGNIVGGLTIARPLMTAVQAELLHRDSSQYAQAITQHRRFDLTLLMGLDLPWMPQPQDARPDAYTLREQSDARLREVLQTHGISYAVVYGTGAQRSAHALQAIAHWAGSPRADAAVRTGNWQWNCEKCSDSACEHRLFTTGLQIGSRPA
jgi:HTH-type transcriptional regulator, transcriptional repressor of NAD biosynthesis genes